MAFKQTPRFQVHRLSIRLSLALWFRYVIQRLRATNLDRKAHFIFLVLRLCVCVYNRYFPIILNSKGLLFLTISINQIFRFRIDLNENKERKNKQEGHYYFDKHRIAKLLMHHLN